MPTVTGQQIREELHRYGLLRVLGTTTAVSGNANRLRDATRLASATLPATSFNDCYVRLTSATEDGEQSRVDYLDQDLGDLYVSPSFTGTVDSGTTYEIWRNGIDPDDVDRLRDEALTTICSQWALFPLSLVTNPAYEAATSDVPDGWTGSSAALTQETAAFPTSLARYTMLVTNSGANGRASSTSIYNIQPTATFYVYVPVSVRVGAATLIVRDITNGADITLTGTSTSTRRGWTGLEATGTIPAGCDEIQIWLRGTSAPDVVEWGPVFFHQVGAHTMPLPARVLSEEDVGRFYRIFNAPVGAGGVFGAEAPREVPDVRRQQVLDTVNLYFNNALVAAPYAYMERVYYTALSTAYQTVANRTTGDAATTRCPLDYAAAATAKLIAEMMLVKRPDESVFYTALRQIADERLTAWETRFGPRPQAIDEREQSLYPHLNAPRRLPPEEAAGGSA